MDALCRQLPARPHRVACRRRRHRPAASAEPEPLEGPSTSGRQRAVLTARGTAQHELSGPAPRLAAFLSSRAGHAYVLKLESFRSAELLSPGVYRCQSARGLPRLLGAARLTLAWQEPVKLLVYEVQPTLELSVEVPHHAESCTVALRASRLEGSAAVRQQSQRFAASAAHLICWTGGVLRSEVQLRVELEIFGLGLLPRAALEKPGSAFLQRLVARNLQAFLPQLETAYRTWEAGEERVALPAGS